jgi:DNA-binding transcriptional ArsR family regulator
VKVHKEVPISEITLRKFEKPYGDIDTCLRKFLMSIGLLQVGESRDDVTKIFKQLLLSKKPLSMSEIIRGTGASPSNARRHLRRLRNLGFVEKIGPDYRISEGKTLPEIVSEISSMLETTMRRVMDYAEFLDSIVRSQKDS